MRRRRPPARPNDRAPSRVTSRSVTPRPVTRTTDEVLERFRDGPQDGVFTDGSCSGNPGPGGWGAVLVRDGALIDERWGDDPDTTNNRMELRAMIEGLRMLPADATCTLYSDSNLCVQTANEWAAGWERRGWRRKGGAIANLELVKELWEEKQAHPRVTIRWIKAHDGSRWNEYADVLATREAGVLR